MSVFVLISSVLPPGADLPGDAPVRLVLTQAETFAAHKNLPQSSIPLRRPLSARIKLVTMVANPANSRMATMGRLMNTHMS